MYFMRFRYIYSLYTVKQYVHEKNPDGRSDLAVSEDQTSC
jgi:hypothetical protein